MESSSTASRGFVSRSSVLSGKEGLLRRRPAPVTVPTKQQGPWPSTGLVLSSWRVSPPRHSEIVGQRIRLLRPKNPPSSVVCYADDVFSRGNALADVGPGVPDASNKNNGEEIATATLTATFGYDGSDAWVVSSSGSHTVEPGWSYSGERISHSGGTATLTATIKSTKGLGQFPVNISLTCSKDGDIS